MTQKAFEAAKDYAEKTGEKPTLNAIQAETGLGITPVRHGITAYEAVEALKADETDPLRMLIEELLAIAPRPIRRQHGVDIMEAIRRWLDEDAQK
jgi:hypothetical protein